MTDFTLGRNADKDDVFLYLKDCCPPPMAGSFLRVGDEIVKVTFTRPLSTPAKHLLPSRQKFFERVEEGLDGDPDRDELLRGLR